MALQRVPGPGRYAVEWQAREPGNYLDLDLPAHRFVVGESDAKTAVEIEIPGAELAASLQRAREN